LPGFRRIATSISPGRWPVLPPPRPTRHPSDRVHRVHHAHIGENASMDPSQRLVKMYPSGATRFCIRHLWSTMALGSATIFWRTLHQSSTGILPGRARVTLEQRRRRRRWIPASPSVPTAPREDRPERSHHHRRRRRDSVSNFVDRATVGETRVRRGAKIDSLVQMESPAWLAKTMSSARRPVLQGPLSGKGVLLAGQVGRFRSSGDWHGAIIYAQSGIGHDVGSGAVMSGSPARRSRMAARHHHVPEIAGLLKGATIRETFPT
jgi:hypothetical protein